MLRKLFALTEQGAKDLKKGIIASVFTSLSLMMPMGLLLMLVMQLLQPLLGMETATPSLGAYAGMCLVLLVIIFLTHYIQYRCTYIAAYAESAQRRIGLAEKLRTLPLSFFGKRDLSDLTTTMMSDCNDLERVFAYTIPQIFGTAISCVIVCLCLFFMDWRMALAILSPFVLAILVLVGSKRLQNHMDLKKIQSKLDAADGIQEFLESIRDLKANNQENSYLAGLDKKLEKIVHTSVCYEMTSGLMITSSQMLLRLGFPATVLMGTLLLTQGELNLFFFLMFLVTASRIYDPLSGVMMQLSEIFNAMLQLRRMKAILVLKNKLGMVRSVDVARHLEVTKPSVCHAVATLREGGFLTMDSDYFLHLTDVGREVAEQIYEKHRFFTDRLIEAGVDPVAAEKDACRMEHVISQESFERLRDAYKTKNE